MDLIVITPNLDIRRSDLMLRVDFSKPFTLRDLLRAAVSSSEISTSEMSELVQCPFIDEIYDEIETIPYEPFPIEQVEYLQLTYSVETFIVKPGVFFHDAYWELSGGAKNKSNFALDMSPTFRLSDLAIRINPKAERFEFQNDKVRSKPLDFYPPLTLLELLYAVCWHLGLFGPPSQREHMIDQFVDAIRKLYYSRHRHGATIEAVTRPLKGAE